MRRVREGAALAGYAVLFAGVIAALAGVGAGLIFVAGYIPNPDIGQQTLHEAGLFITGGMVAFAVAIWAMRR